MDAPLNFNKPISNRSAPERPEVSEDTITLSDIVEQFTGIIRRQLPIFVFVFGCAIALGVVYLFTTPAPRFTVARNVAYRSKLNCGYCSSKMRRWVTCPSTPHRWKLRSKF